MLLKLTRLRNNIAGPLVDPLLKEPWRIGVEKEIDDQIGAQILTKYPNYFVKVEKQKDPLKRIKKIEPKADKMLRNMKDKASGA